MQPEVTRAKCACAVHMCITTAARNFCQPVLAKIYRDYAIMEAWLSFNDVTTVRNKYVYTTNTVSEARVLEYSYY